MTVRSVTQPLTGTDVLSAGPVSLHTCPQDACQTSDLHIITAGLQARFMFIINDPTVYCTHPPSYCKPIMPCTVWYGQDLSSSARLSMGDEGLVLAANRNSYLLVPGTLITLFAELMFGVSPPENTTWPPASRMRNAAIVDAVKAELHERRLPAAPEFERLSVLKVLLMKN